MGIPEQIRASVRVRLDAIDNDTFCQDDVKLLLIELRDYIKDCSALKEFAHFVAHPERDRGIVHKSIDDLYWRACVMFRKINGLIINPSAIPEDVYKVVELHFQHVKPNPAKLKAFKRTYKPTNNPRVYVPTSNRAPTESVVDCIKEATSLLVVRSALTQKEFISDLSSALSSISLGQYIGCITKQQNGIMTCVLAMLHGSAFVIDNQLRAYAVVSCSESKVELHGRVETDLSSVGVSFPVVLSDVTVKESFSESMFHPDWPSHFSGLSPTDIIRVKRTSNKKLVFERRLQGSSSSGPSAP